MTGERIEPLFNPDDDTPDPEAPAIIEAIRRGCLTEDVMREWGLLDDE